jgi:CheY-like chemotaxis protein
MGGRMWVESEPGRGSTFQFTILVKSVASKPRPYLVSGKTQMSGRRLLIVDDNATNRRILATLALNWGMEARAAQSGSEALAWIEAGEEFDIGILDMQMPEMDGVMLARKIRERRDAARLPMILLSSVGGRDFDTDAAVFAAYLTKPAKPSHLFDALQEVFHSKGEPPEDRLAAMRGMPTIIVSHLDRILLAEDNVVNQKVALLILAKLGYRADVAANGREAIQALERQPYDVVLMDVQMPELDGLEASRIIRDGMPGLSPRPWIIALTANAMQGDRDLCLAAGMDDYITKPIKAEELAGALARRVHSLPG